MSTSPIPQTIDILSREKGIDPQVIISAIEYAVVTAARKQFKTGEDLRARYNPETGDVELFALMTVVDEVQDSATEISLADVEAMGVEGAEVGDQIFDVKQSANLIAHRFAIAVSNPTGLVDVNAQHKVVARADRLPVDHLQALSRCYPLDDSFNRFSVKLDHRPKKKSGPSPLSQQAGHNTFSNPQKASR